MRKVKRGQAGKNAAYVGKLFRLVSPFSQFCGQPARTRLAAGAGTLALSAGTLMASAGRPTPYRLVPAHFYPRVLRTAILRISLPFPYLCNCQASVRHTVCPVLPPRSVAAGLLLWVWRRPIGDQNRLFGMAAMHAGFTQLQ